MNPRAFVPALLVAATIVAAVAGSSLRPAMAADAPRDTLRLVNVSDPNTLNPLLATNQADAEIGGLMLEQLVEFDENNQPQPVLAARVPTQANGGISADGLTITFHLRHGVKWHDGGDFTAADVLFTIHAVLDVKNNVANRDVYTNIASADAPDPFTVRFRLKQRQAFFISEVGAGYPILPAHLLASSANLTTDPFNAAPVGTGPYRFVRWERGDRIELTANPAYYRGAPKIPNVVVSIVPDTNTLGIQIREHAIDFTPVESSVFNQLRDLPGVVRTIAPHNDVNAISMNVTRPIMRDRTVRLAIARAIDRRRIVETISFGTGTPAYGDLPLFMYGGHRPAAWDAADPAAVRAMLDKDGWKLGPDGVRVKSGVPLRLQFIDIGGSVSGATLAVQIVQMLRDVGIAVDYKTFAPILYFQPAAAGGPLMSGNFDIGYVGFSGGNNPGNAYIFSCATRSPNGYNSSRYCTPEMDRLQTALQNEYDPAKQNRLVAQIEDLAVADAPYAFIYHTPYRMISNPALVKPPPSQTDYWYGIERWYFKPAP